MNIQNRIKKMENEMQIGKGDSGFCQCGTPYIATFVITTDVINQDIVNNVCPDCGRAVKPLTRAEFAKDAHKYEFVIIEPKADFSREEFAAHQNKHVVSRHRTYEEFMEEQNAR